MASVSDRSNDGRGLSMNERIGQRRGNPEGKRRNRQSLSQGNGSVTVFFACMQRSLFGKRSNPDGGNATCCVSGIFAGHDWRDSTVSLPGPVRVRETEGREEVFLLF